MKKLIALLFLAAGLAGGAAASEGGIPWDRFPMEKVRDLASLQNGARLFANYCLNCHAAAYMRYNRLRDIGIDEDLIKKNLMFASEKIGETMTVAMEARQAKEWFGGVPPDLSVISRSRSGSAGSGADYLYTYLRSYYRDETKATGWNNLAYPNVGMPHALWELQGPRRAVFVTKADPHDASKTMHLFTGYEQIAPGRLSSVEYDNAVADLVAYMQWMGEPAQSDRFRIGVGVLVFLGLFTVIAWRLNAAYWNHVK